MLFLVDWLGCLLQPTLYVQRSRLLQVIYDAGIKTELFPLLILSLDDRLPVRCFHNPAGAFGAAGQFGIYATPMLVPLLGFPLNQAASIGVIGADSTDCDFVGSKSRPEILPRSRWQPILRAHPVIQPPIRNDDHPKELDWRSTTKPVRA